jgi:hypothetical protein
VTTQRRAPVRPITAVAAGLAAAAAGLASVAPAMAAPASAPRRSALPASSGPGAAAPGAAAPGGAAPGGAAPGGAGPSLAAATPKTTTYDSLHWVGYTFPVKNVTGVRADWTEPTVTGKAGSEEFIWLGVGGWNATDNNIVQAGTYAYLPGGGQRDEGIWYERVPTDPDAQFPGIAVDAGDHIVGTITLIAGTVRQWRISIVDSTLGTSFAKTVKFKSLEADPSFVVEDPNAGPPSPKGPFYPFPNWKSVTFTHVAARIGKTWTAVAKFTRYRVNMVRGTKTYATAGVLTSQSSFTVTDK